MEGGGSHYLNGLNSKEAARLSREIADRLKRLSRFVSKTYVARIK